MNRALFFLLILLISNIILGCSEKTTPLIPENGFFNSQGKSGMSFYSMNELQVPQISSLIFQNSSYAYSNPDGHEILGIRKIRLYQDGHIEVVPLRTGQVHYNVTSIIFKCSDCIKIGLGTPPGPNQFEFLVTLKNPTNLNAYDVTGIVRSSGDIKFLNPDSYTFLFSIPGDTKPNPFTAWAKTHPQRLFAAKQSYTEKVRFEKAGTSKFAEMDYIFQASFPSNQEEPYGIWDMSATGDLQADSSNQVDLQCKVGDWQNNIESVKIDLTPLGGPANQPMTFISGNIWKVPAVKYNPVGQGLGEHRLKITATSGGGATYNYLKVKVISSTPIKQGPFEIVTQNWPLESPNGPSDGMDIAVIGATDGTSSGMVFGDDDTYHFWSNNYKDGSFGLYSSSTGQPIKPFDLPNGRFDFADKVIPNTSVDTLFNLSWGETNTSTAVLDNTTVPPVMAAYRIALWYLNEGNLKLTGNVLVIEKNAGPPVTFGAIAKPIEIASGFRGDGLLYVTMVFAAGNETKFPIVDILAMHPPLDFAGNPDIIKKGYEIPLEEGSGPGVVNRDAIVGVDVDDSGIMEISGGYGGHAWVAVVEAGVEKALEIIDADIDAPKNTFITVNLPAIPRDVEILPLKEAGQSANWIAVLCGDNLIRLYDYTGALKQIIGGPPYMIGSALRLDIDDENLAIHVLHQGPSSPLVTVYKWAG